MEQKSQKDTFPNFTSLALESVGACDASLEVAFKGGVWRQLNLHAYLGLGGWGAQCRMPMQGAQVCHVPVIVQVAADLADSDCLDA